MVQLLTFLGDMVFSSLAEITGKNDVCSRKALDNQVLRDVITRACSPSPSTLLWTRAVRIGLDRCSGHGSILTRVTISRDYCDSTPIDAMASRSSSLALCLPYPALSSQKIKLFIADDLSRWLSQLGYHAVNFAASGA
jgi:hypothetical protein